MPTTLKEIAVVAMPLPGSYTKVLLERTKGMGMAAGGICLDIPTDVIPLSLRAIGSRFVVVCTTVADTKEAETMSPEEMRQSASIKIEAINS